MSDKITDEDVEEMYEHARTLREMASALNKVATIHEISAAKFDTIEEAQAYVNEQFEKRLTEREKEALEENGL
jgi:aminoglycoside phosphotransferase (APT) family kinase protein